MRPHPPELKMLDKKAGEGWKINLLLVLQSL
jgi:hypothetical protein